MLLASFSKFFGRHDPYAAGKEKYLSPLIGLTTGLVTAATAVFVIPAVPYLQALSLEKDELIQALGLSFTVSTIAMAAGLAQGGVLQMEGTAISLMALAPAGDQTPHTGHHHLLIDVNQLPAEVSTKKLS